MCEPGIRVAVSISHQEKGHGINIYNSSRHLFDFRSEFVDGLLTVNGGDLDGGGWQGLSHPRVRYAGKSSIFIICGVCDDMRRTEKERLLHLDTISCRLCQNLGICASDGTEAKISPAEEEVTCNLVPKAPFRNISLLFIFIILYPDS